MRRLCGFTSRASATFVVALLLLATVTLAACGGTGTTTSPSATPLLSTSTSASPTPLPVPTVSGTIAFERVVRAGRGGNGDIYVVNADGTGLKALAEAPGWEDHPSWSPDGKKIVYDALPKGDDSVGAIMVMNADGSGKQQLTKVSVKGIMPAWSPQGRQIVFMRYMRLDEPSVWVMNDDGSGLRRVMKPGPGATDDSFPTWAPNGKILFLRLSDVYAVTPDGSGLVRLTRGNTVVNYALSPDGKRLAVRRADGSLKIIPAQSGGAPVTLLDSVSDYITQDPNVALSWTQDGKALAVASSTLLGWNGSRLYVANADGSGLSAVPGVSNAEDPAWQPQ